MNKLNKNLLMGGVAACAVAFASCGEKTDSAAAGKADEAASVDAAKIETVSLNLSGLK